MAKAGFWVAIALALAASVGAWVFFHPAPPPLAPPHAGATTPIDERMGVYDAEDGRTLLIAPAIEGGLRLYVVSEWSGAPRFTEQNAAWTRGADQLVFSGGGLSLLYEDGRRLEAARRGRQPYSLREVRIERDVTLEGWLFEPTAPAGVGVVILHGSGASDRANGWYAYLAHELAARGVTVLLPDKRGSGRSGGDWRDAPFNVLADDGAAWLARVRSDASNVERAGFVGVSQGGLIAPIAARIGDADFAVAQSATATALEEQLTTEVRNDMRTGGAPEALIPFLSPMFTARAKARQATFWAEHASYEMMAEWEKWSGPFFLALGREDERDNVPVAASVAVLERDYSAASNFEWRVYEGVGHPLTLEDGRFHPNFLRDQFAALGIAPEPAAPSP